MPDATLDRDQLVKTLHGIADPIAAAGLVLAWGGMKRDAGRALFGSGDIGWLALVDRMRDGHFSRADAYDAFRTLRLNGRLPGMGPAYFTKLIFFLRPAGPDCDDRGYIMDQWTSRSINLLFGQELVLMQGHVWVSPENTAATYECFNLLIEHIANQWRVPGDKVEQTMFGRGGKKRDAWRAHVLRARGATG